MIATTITLNGKQVRATVPPRTSLADFIREHAGLTGTHLGCEHGVCGACTVEVDGEIARSCITLAVACDGASVRTIEGFDSDPAMERLRRAFTEEHALQCGYCTPGMLIAARDLIRRGEALPVSAIREAMSGNLCRCTGYAGIITAVKRVLDAAVATGAFKAARDGGAPLGPAGSNSARLTAHTQPSPAKAAAQNAYTGPAPTAVQKRGTIEVTTRSLGEAEGLTMLSQSFCLPHPREEVWPRFRDLNLLVRCLPGASLSSIDSEGRFSGTMRVVFGPISPVFKGNGIFTASDAEYLGRIEGAGQDQRAGAKAHGEMSFNLIALDAGSTAVEAKISYRLTGALAQFGRPSMVRGIVAEIGAMLASNIDRAIAGTNQESVGVPHLSGGMLLLSILKAWASALWRQISLRR